jgi:hypothetical protein
MAKSIQELMGEELKVNHLLNVAYEKAEGLGLSFEDTLMSIAYYFAKRNRERNEAEAQELLSGIMHKSLKERGEINEEK